MILCLALCHPCGCEARGVEMGVERITDEEIEVVSTQKTGESAGVRYKDEGARRYVGDRNGEGSNVGGCECSMVVGRSMQMTLKTTRSPSRCTIRLAPGDLSTCWRVDPDLLFSHAPRDCRRLPWFVCFDNDRVPFFAKPLALAWSLIPFPLLSSLLALFRRSWYHPPACLQTSPGKEKAEYRLFTHFYTFIGFHDPVAARHHRRLVRDVMHFREGLFCIAATIVGRLRKAGQGTPGRWSGYYGEGGGIGGAVEAVTPEGEGTGAEWRGDAGSGYQSGALRKAGFSTFHIRRGDFQYVKVSACSVFQPVCLGKGTRRVVLVRA